VDDKLSGDAPRPKEPQVHSTLVEAEHDGSMGRSARGVDSANGTHSPGDQSPQDAVANESQHWPHRLWKFFTSTPSRKVFSGLGAVLTAVVAAIVAPIVAGWFSAGHSASITATQQIFYQPWTSSGLSRNIHVTSIHPGSCQSQSSFSSSTDAFRCIEGNFIEDPCFASPYVNNGIDPGAKNQVACPSLESYNPNSAIIIHLTQPLPFINDTRSANYLRPWLIVLANGESCVNPGPYGGVTTARGLDENYFCHGGGGLFGYPQRSSPIWTIFAQFNGAADLTNVQIAEAYY
jgi:hypothetical protein